MAKKKKNKLSKALIIRTPFPKLLATILFIFLSLGGFYLGTQYLKQSNSSVLGAEQPKNVILLYGWHGNVTSWNIAKASYESKGYVVHVLNLPRNGDKLDDTKANAAFTNNYISSQGLSNVKLDGHSLGGWVALYMGLVQRNSAVSSIVLRDTGTGCVFGIPPDQCTSSNVLREIKAATVSSVPVLNLSSKSDKIAGVSCLKVISGLKHEAFQTDAAINTYAIGWPNVSPCSLSGTPTLTPPTATPTRTPTPTTPTPTLTPPTATPTPSASCSWLMRWRKQC